MLNQLHMLPMVVRGIDIIERHHVIPKPDWLANPQSRALGFSLITVVIWIALLAFLRLGGIYPVCKGCYL